MRITKFEELQIWRDALIITKQVYDLSKKPLFNKDFALQDQIKRAIISVSSNIVEGFEKNNNNEFIRFLKIAKGSAGEVKNQLHIALIIGYITDEEFKNIASDMEKLSNGIGAFISYLEKTKKTRQAQVKPANPSTR